MPVLDLDLFFGRLKGRGLRLGIATMDSEESARASMRMFKADRHLDFICGFDTGHGMKPGGGMVEAFARLTATAPANSPWSAIPRTTCTWRMRGRRAR